MYIQNTKALVDRPTLQAGSSKSIDLPKMLLLSLFAAVAAATFAIKISWLLMRAGVLEISSHYAAVAARAAAAAAGMMR